MTIAQRSFVGASLALFAAVTVAAALSSPAAALVTNRPPPRDQSNCLKIMNRKGNLLKCGSTTYVLPSTIRH